MQHTHRGARHAGLAAGLMLLLALTACGAPGGAGYGAGSAAATPAPGLPPILVPPGRPTATPPTANPAPAASPTAAGTPTPADPYSLLDPFTLFDPSEGAVLVKEDLVALDGREPKEALLTISAPPVISGAAPIANLFVTSTQSVLAVAVYDPLSTTWQLRYHTPAPGVPGRAVPLPAGAQGGNPLRANPPLPVLQLRTETTPTLGSGIPTVTLRLYTWRNGALQPLHRRPAGTAADEDAVFTGAADVQLIDIDNDGRAEVVVDDGGKTAIWKWDGARFVPR